MATVDVPPSQDQDTNGLESQTDHLIANVEVCAAIEAVLIAEGAELSYPQHHNISEQTFFRRRNKFGGMDVPDARRLKDLESENVKLKRLVAEQLLAIERMKEIVRKK